MARIAIGLLLAMALACNSPHVAVCTEVSLSELAEQQWGSHEWPESWPDRSVSCAIGNYVLLTPASESDIDHVMLLRGRDTMFIHQGDVSSIFEHGRPTLGAIDSDGDGAFDQVSYSVYRDEEWDEIRVRDRNFDAQPDMRTYHKTGVHEYWMWVENGWYKTPRLGSMQVIVDGTPRAYEVVDDRFVFAGGGESRITTP